MDYQKNGCGEMRTKIENAIVLLVIFCVLYVVVLCCLQDVLVWRGKECLIRKGLGLNW